MKILNITFYYHYRWSLLVWLMLITYFGHYSVLFQNMLDETTINGILWLNFLVIITPGFYENTIFHFTGKSFCFHYIQTKHPDIWQKLIEKAPSYNCYSPTVNELFSFFLNEYDDETDKILQQIKKGTRWGTLFAIWAFLIATL